MRTTTIEKTIQFWIHPRLNQAWESGKKYIVWYSGRGAGGSTQEGFLALRFALEHQGSRILCIRGTQNKISESSLQVLKDIITLMDAWELFESSENQLRAKNGSEFIFYGAKAYQSFRSLQRISLVWIDEAHELSDEAWDVIIPTIRPFLPGDPDTRFLLKYNPQDGNEAVHQRYVVNSHPKADVFQINYPGNPYFPQTLKEEMEYCRATNYAKYEHIWLGKPGRGIAGALWKYADFVYGAAPEGLRRVVVAVDPSGSIGENASACGIIGAGLLGKQHYILDDGTLVALPLEWARAAINMYYRLKADCIVVETNYGGAMVKTIINQIDPRIPVHEVSATRGKIVRAEPAHALYQQGLVTHVRHFTELEYEMTTYTGKKGEKSPNRLDAVVWVLTELTGPQGAGLVKTKSEKKPVTAGYRRLVF